MGSSPCSFVRGDSLGKNIGVGCHALLQGIFPSQGSSPSFPHCRQILYHLSHHRSSDKRDSTSFRSTAVFCSLFGVGWGGCEGGAGAVVTGCRGRVPLGEARPEWESDGPIHSKLSVFLMWHVLPGRQIQMSHFLSQARALSGPNGTIQRLARPLRKDDT